MTRHQLTTFPLLKFRVDSVLECKQKLIADNGKENVSEID